MDPHDDALVHAATVPGDTTDRSRDEDTRQRRIAARPHFPPLAQPERIGRYQLVDRIGSGAMGVVYAARDDTLARKVAIKVLLRGHAADGHALRRLEREARAMARIAHPNVVVVHEVGASDGLLFVAMELVDGVTLDAWCRAAGRGWREKLEVFIQAGQGLAAAHDVGLVHRDFKPANVLVDRSGRARVVDFGLARAGAEERADDTTAEVGPLDAELTQAGAILGTPAYMPPEQFEGRPATAASDQFSFCVALYEALTGARPFSGATHYQLLAAIRAGHVRPPPAPIDAPSALLPLVARGLAVDPATRWPSMHALLAELTRVARPRSVRRTWLALGLAAAVGGGFGLAALFLPRGPACSAVVARLEGIADPARREAVRAALLAADKPYAAALAHSVDVALARRVDAWSRAAIENCEATRVVGDQSEALFDLRAACLERRLIGIGAAIDQLLELGPRSHQRALDLVDALDPLAACSDRASLVAAVRPPDDEDARARLAAVERDLVAARALRDAGRAAEALAQAEPALAEARDMSFAPAIAETALLVSRLEAELSRADEAAAHLEEATNAAAVAGRDDLLTETWLAAVWQRSVLGASGELLDAWIRAAEVALARAGRPPRLAALFHTVVAHAYQRQSRYDQATTHYDAAIALLREHDLGEALRLRAEVNRATLLVETDPGARTEATLQAVLKDIEVVLGAGHPLTSNVHYSLGYLAERQLRFADALRHFERARAIKEVEHGTDHAGTLQTIARIAAVLAEIGREDDAAATLDDLLVRTRALHGERHQQVSTLLLDAAALLLRRGAVDLALARIDEALAIDRDLFGDDHTNVAIDRTNLGEALAARGDHARALVELTAARDVFARTVGPEHEHVAAVQAAIGRSLGAVGRRDEAIAALTQARALLLAKFGPTYHRLSDVDLDLAEVLIAARRIDEALRRAQDAVDLARTSQGERSAAAAAARGRLGVLLERAGRLDLATTTLESALRDAEAAGVAGRALAGMKIDLGRALSGRHDERERARDLVRAALSDLVADDPLRADAGRLLSDLDRR